MSGEFKRSDEALKKIRRAMTREYQNYSTLLRFDELRVLEVRKGVDALYGRMDAEVVPQLERVAREVYRDTKKELGAPVGRFPWALFVAGALHAYSPVTEFVYTREWRRKRDRTVEAIMSSADRQALRYALRRSLDVTYNQVRQYSDDIEVGARLKAFEDEGIRRVRWVTMEDEKVCKICRERDGQVYLLSQVPPRHWRCRCWLVPA